MRQVLEAAGLVVRSYEEHLPLARLPAADQRAFRFAFVRHPLDWYESWWRYQTDTGWSSRFETPVLPDCAYRRSDFVPFVRTCLEKAPGMVSVLYELFVGTPEAPIEFIGHLETLRADVDRLRRARGWDVGAAVLALPPQLVSHPHRLTWTPELRTAVASTERRAMARFGYTA